ncbi:hypothetical protein [Microbacterium sp. F2]|uniref:hypothetical protein n=1 Tax=Microbacterium sp. F2 TaxID=3422228 RepID=UPI003FD090DE
MTNVEAFEAFEWAQEVAAYRHAKAEDDGTRVTLDELSAVTKTGAAATRRREPPVTRE